MGVGVMSVTVVAGSRSAMERFGKEAPSLPVNVLRNPIGPSESSKDNQGGEVAKGFKLRSSKRPKSSEQAACVNGSV